MQYCYIYLKVENVFMFIRVILGMKGEMPQGCTKDCHINYENTPNQEYIDISTQLIMISNIELYKSKANYN